MRLRSLFALALLAACASCAAPDVTTIDAFVTRDGRLTASPLRIPPGETIVRIQNDESSRQRFILVRTERPSLPLVRGAVPMGKDAELDYEGDGYRVVVKLERTPAYYSGDPIVVRMHDYLEPGTYELISNLPGHYAAGKRIRIEVMTT